MNWNKNTTVRIYLDYSANLSRKRAEFNDIRQALYSRGIKFQLLYPSCLHVTFGENTFKFTTPEEANAFYAQQRRDGLKRVTLVWLAVWKAGQLALCLRKKKLWLNVKDLHWKGKRKKDWNTDAEVKLCCVKLHLRVYFTGCFVQSVSF